MLTFSLWQAKGVSVELEKYFNISYVCVLRFYYYCTLGLEGKLIIMIHTYLFTSPHFSQRRSVETLSPLPTSERSRSRGKCLAQKQSTLAPPASVSSGSKNGFVRLTALGLEIHQLARKTVGVFCFLLILSMYLYMHSVYSGFHKITYGLQ